MTERILVVDDDLDSLKLIGLMLQRTGYEVSAANTGGQALSKALAEHPDLIILDVMMPDMNGYEVCRRLRTNAETKAIPIIMFTAKTLIDDKVAGFEAGADDYLTKPTHPSELASRVRSILSRNVQKRSQADSGTIIGVVGVKGGVGTSTVALNLAAARVLAGENALVVDFRPGAGTIGLALGFSDADGLSNLLARAATEIKPRAVEQEIVSHPSGLRALLASAKPREMQMHYRSETATTLLRTIRQMSKLVVVDLGSGYNPHFTSLQLELDQLLVTLDSSPVTVAMAKALLSEIDPERKSDKLLLVGTNRTNALGQNNWGDVESTLGRPVNTVLAPSLELIQHAYQASVPPVIFQPAAMYSTQMMKLAEDLAAAQTQSQLNATS